MLGELRYVTKHLAHDIVRVKQLEHSCSLLGQALLICAPELNLAQIAPIRFRPSEPFSSAELTRAILAELRMAVAPQSLTYLVSALALRYNLPEVVQSVRFQARMQRTLDNLQKQGFVASCGATNRWTINMALVIENLRR